MTDGEFLRGKAAFVTAGSRNLGATIALALAERGADVALSYHESATDAAALVDRLSSFGGSHAAVKGDAGTPAGIRALLSEARRVLGDRPLQVLVNNYGPFSMTPFVELADDEFDRIWNANVTSAWVAAHDVRDEMRQAGWGRIVNVSAGAAYLRNHSIYTLAKASLITLTESLAIEFGPEITVNAVAPGQVVESADDIAQYDPGFVERAIAHTPTGRLVTRSEVARIVANLCGPLFASVTGVTIPIDGGWHLPRF